MPLHALLPHKVALQLLETEEHFWPPMRRQVQRRRVADEIEPELLERAEWAALSSEDEEGQDETTVLLEGEEVAESPADDEPGPAEVEAANASQPANIEEVPPPPVPPKAAPQVRVGASASVTVPGCGRQVRRSTWTQSA